MGVKTMNLGGTKPQSNKNIIQLYHGSPCREFTPTYGKGKDQHDYGRGFYLTPDKELAKEWACGDPDSRGHWLHTFNLDLSGLRVLDFELLGEDRSIYWITEILRHRSPDGGNTISSTYLDFLLKVFNANTENYDVVCGWRADDSYFSIAKEFLDGRLIYELLEESLRLGDLCVQYCCRSAKAFEKLKRIGDAERVNYSVYRASYSRRDSTARQSFTELFSSPRNKPSNGSTVALLHYKWLREGKWR